MNAEWWVFYQSGGLIEIDLVEAPSATDACIRSDKSTRIIACLQKDKAAVIGTLTMDGMDLGVMAIDVRGPIDV